MLAGRMAEIGPIDQGVAGSTVRRWRTPAETHLVLGQGNNIGLPVWVGGVARR